MPTGEQDKDISETDMVGRQVGKYRITRLLGRGGMGAVFELVHESVGQRAAIKVLLAKYAQDPEFVKRFFDEAMVVNRIQHQGVVKSFDHGQFPDGNLYIVMELLLGESMRARLEQVAEQKSRLAFSTTASLMIQLVDTLAEVHEKGVIHRDLKPENIFLVNDSAVVGGTRTKILDFGIAKIQQSSELRDNESPGPLTTVGRILGTPTYMSPEQCDGRPVLTASSDIYALGVILYEMLSGSPPFGGTSGNSIMAMHMLKEPAPLSNVPRPLELLLRGMLAKKPENRPSLKQVRSALDAYIARPTASLFRSWLPVVGIATALLLVSGGLWWKVTREATRARLTLPQTASVSGVKPKVEQPSAALPAQQQSQETSVADGGQFPDASAIATQVVMPQLREHANVPVSLPPAKLPKAYKKPLAGRLAKPANTEVPPEPDKLVVPIVE